MVPFLAAKEIENRSPKQQRTLDGRAQEDHPDFWTALLVRGSELLSKCLPHSLVSVCTLGVPNHFNPKP